MHANLATYFLLIIGYTENANSPYYVGTSMIEANVIESKVSLQLAGGYLPVPSPMSPKISKVDGTPSNGCIQLDFVHASVGNDFDQLRQDIVDPPPRRRTTSIAVRDQLSSITAPMREDNDSESSSNPESDPGNGWGLEDIPGSDLWRPGFDPDRDEMEYFGESMYGLNNRDDNGFWSQYPGLD
ncbi:hypothetical protein BU23DRAFT_54091 [Bimuria novae-zelandiae CBS 107.79]|uniref:Uncharacterized protein n=1 Tax=Bimuria novae-zelandiae CBS 107.79 TaxID=1447943 RepID=A0A6A5UH97_9PLEO|nr:hypothetical protein BU23DRAFT_54091 [Bimuria novae-zelandiae CBS 107.79]